MLCRRCHGFFSVGRDRSALGVLLAAWLAVHLPLFRHLGTWVGDTGKEFGVPRDLLAGALLYRDTFWPYGPFPPYLNAGLMAVFGTHTDVLLVVARLLGLAVCLAAYRLVRRFAGPGQALLAGLAVLVFSTTSGLFAVPYSFATLWSCLLGLVGMDCLLAANGEGAPRRWLLAAGGCGALVLLAKFTVFLPLAVPACLLVWYRADRSGNRVRARLARGAWFFLPALLVVVPVYGWFLWRTGWDSFAIQALGGFHSHNIRHGFFYHLLWQTMRAADGGLRAVAAALLVWGVLAVAGLGILAWLVAWRRGRADVPSALFLLFALLNLGQMNSTSHVPYVFPAILVAALWAGAVLERTGEVPWLRIVRYAVVLGVLAVPVVRLPLVLGKPVHIETTTASLWFPEVPGRALARTIDLVQSESPPGEPIGIMTGHDFLYQFLDRPNRLGYYYTLYEPFWRPWAEERFLARFRAARFRLLVTNPHESFTYAYVLDIPETEKRINDQLFADYEKMTGDDCLPYIVWRRRP